MAQDFEREYKSSISNSSGSAPAFTATDSDDALIPIPAGGSLELIDSGSKIVLQNGDVLKAFADTATAIDVLVSRVDSIST